MMMSLMKRFSIIILLVYSFGVNAQWINCDSNLYIDSVFTPVLTDTVKFGENYTPAGLFKELYMHVYQPKEDTSSYRPTLVLAFGGAYIRGNKEDVRPICEDFASRGYVCVSIDYRLVDIIAFPDSSIILDVGLKARGDMIAAIKYLKWDAANGNKWRINPDKIFVGGASSGAITAMSVAYFNENDSVDIKEWMKPIIESNGGFEGSSSFDFAVDYDYKVVGVANMLGAVVDLEYIDEGEPLIISIHGTDDDVVPYGDGFITVFDIPVFRLKGSSLVHERALEQNIKSTFISVEGGKHGDFLKDENLPWLDSMVNRTLHDFYDYVLCAEPSSIFENESNKYDIRLYPNPTSDKLKFKNIENKNTERITYKIFSISGQIVTEGLIDLSKESINIRDLNNGLYVIRISNGTDVFTKSFVVGK